MRLRVTAFVEGLRASLFLIPMASVILAIAAGLVSLTVDDRLDVSGTDLPLGIGSTVESARSVLSTIAGATIAFAGIAFSVSLLVIQLASSQYSPRVIHTLFRDPFNKRVMGIVVGTFTYCVIVLRSVRSPLEQSGDAVIPNVSVTIAVVLGIVAILSVIAFIDHNAHSMDVSEILERVRQETVERVRDDWEPADASPTGPSGPPSAAAQAAAVIVRFDRSGWIQVIDTESLLESVPSGTTVVLHTYAGHYAVEGGILCSISTPLGVEAPETVAADARAAVAVGDTRTMQQDVSYGLRQLTDVGLRALSPGVNDPTTAQDAVLHATAVLAEMLRRTPPSPDRDGENGRTLLLLQAPDHCSLIRLTYEEMRLAAAQLPTVSIYLLEALRQLVEATGGALTSAASQEIREQARLVVLGCEAANLLPTDVQRVRDARSRAFDDLD